MERLKNLSDLFSEDQRFAEMMQFAADDEDLGYSLKRHYERFATLDWPRGAPEEIVSGFVTAQHLAIYAWYVFPFASVAELQALITLEHALRRRMSNEPARGLKDRLRYAVSAGWIKGSRLRMPDPHIRPIAREDFARRPMDPRGDESLASFIDNIPESRYWLAHGNWIGGIDPFMQLDIVLQLINQIYPYDPA